MVVSLSETITIPLRRSKALKCLCRACMRPVCAATLSPEDPLSGMAEPDELGRQVCMEWLCCGVLGHGCALCHFTCYVQEHCCKRLGADAGRLRP